MHLVKELPFLCEERFLASSHLIILQCIVVVNNLRHVVHFLLVAHPVTLTVALDYVAELFCGQSGQIFLNNIESLNKLVVNLLEDTD